MDFILNILIIFGIIGMGFLILWLFGYLREQLHKKNPSLNNSAYAYFTLIVFGLSALALYSIIIFFIYN